MPYLAVCFFLITLSAIALPLTGSFIAEFLVLMGSYLSGKFWVLDCCLIGCNDRYLYA